MGKVQHCKEHPLFVSVPTTSGPRKAPGEPARGVESDCNERARGLFNGHCGCRQRFGRSILSIGTSTRHSGHLTVFMSSISMRMADAKEKAYWEQPATGCSARRAVDRRPRPVAPGRPAGVPMGVADHAIAELGCEAEPKGRFRKSQIFCEAVAAYFLAPRTFWEASMSVMSLCEIQ